MSSFIISPVKAINKCNFKKFNSFVHISLAAPQIPNSPTWLNEPCFINARYADYADTVYNLAVRPDDVWVISFPKSGTTWTQEMVWLLANELDYCVAAELTLDERFMFLEFSTLIDIDQLANTIDEVAKAPSPRFIKSHLPPALLPRALWTVQPKIVYVTRNPKDTLVSYYHHYKNVKGWKGDLNDFIELFLAELVVYAPMRNSVLSFWNMRAEKNVQFVTYEEMKSGLRDVIGRISEFLGKRYDERDLERLQKHLSVEEMRENVAVNKSQLMDRLGREFR